MYECSLPLLSMAAAPMKWMRGKKPRCKHILIILTKSCLGKISYLSLKKRISRRLIFQLWTPCGRWWVSNRILIPSTFYFISFYMDTGDEVSGWWWQCCQASQPIYLRWPRVGATQWSDAFNRHGIKFMASGNGEIREIHLTLINVSLPLYLAASLCSVIC